MPEVLFFQLKLDNDDLAHSYKKAVWDAAVLWVCKQLLRLWESVRVSVVCRDRSPQAIQSNWILQLEVPLGS